VAVQELARFRIRALPSHFLLNCAITWRENIIIRHDGCETETAVSVVIGTHLAVAKAEKYSHTETLEERDVF